MNERVYNTHHSINECSGTRTPTGHGRSALNEGTNCQSDACSEDPTERCVAAATTTTTTTARYVCFLHDAFTQLILLHVSTSCRNQCCGHWLGASVRDMRINGSGQWTRQRSSTHQREKKCTNTHSHTKSNLDLHHFLFSKQTNKIILIPIESCK